MSDFSPILCDGCGQPASPQHLARRFQRLEWATRYRPIHLQTLLLGAASPATDAEYLYSSATAHTGEAERLLTAAGTSLADPIAEVLHAEFQRRGVYLSHVLECPLDSNSRKESPLNALLDSRLAAVFTRIRRSWKPKRLVFISTAIGPFVENFAAAKLECELVLDGNRPFGLDDPDARNAKGSVTRLRDVLAGQVMR
jgi:hypothetical protein